MMKRRTFLSLFLLTLVFGSGAQAADVYTSSRVYLRAGPDGGYPALGLLDRGEKLDLIGCLSSREWCEVKTRDKERGWVYASYLDGVYDGRRVTFITNYGNRVNIVVFEPVYYWDSYYRSKDFYKDRDRWLPKNKKHNYSRYNHHDHGDKRSPDIRPEPEKTHPVLKPLTSDKYKPECSIFQPDC